MGKSLSVQAVLFRGGVLLAFVCLAGLFGSGNSCHDEGDAAQIQQQALFKADSRKHTKRPDSVISKLPADTKFKGFKPQSTSQTEGPSPQAVSASVIGVLLEDYDFNNQADAIYFLYALTADEAFLDLNGNETYDQASEPHLLYTAFDHSMLWSDPRGGELAPPGSYSVVLFRKVLELKSPSFFGLTFPVHLYFDDPQGGQGQEEVVNKFLLFGAQILPHVPFGTAGPYQITTQIVVNNPNRADSSVRLEFFDAATGAGIPVGINGETAVTHLLTVPASSSRLYEIEPPANELKLAWAYVEGTPVVEASANFVTFPQGAVPASQPEGIEKTILAEAGIAGTDVQLHHVLSVVKSPNGVSTSFAIVNPTQQPAQIKVTLKREPAAGASGSQTAGAPRSALAADEQVAQTTLTLQPSCQTAVFFDKLLGISDERFEGTVVLDSDTDIAVASLKTFKGLQSASLPSGFFKIGRSR